MQVDGLNAFGEAVQSSPFGVWAGGDAYPIANLVHLLGLVMLVGGIGILDLRLAGLFRRIPAAPLSAALTPIAIAGLVLMVPSGATMFAADAAALVQFADVSPEAAADRAGAHQRRRFPLPVAETDRAVGCRPAALGPLMAAASVLLWLSVAALGRMIAYS